MIKNDYRRAFIMLRPIRQGYGGHVRLERRTLAGNMYFIVTAPEGAGPLCAALAGQRDGQYYATPIGTLARDRRGQLTLAYSFDPRGIDGRPLEAYAWVCVADAGNGCCLALTGNVEGSREVDPAALARAVCALFTEADAPAADLPAPDEAPAQAPPVTQDAPAEPVEPPAPVSPESDVKIYTRTRAARGAVSPTPPDEAAVVEVEAVATETVAEAAPAPEVTAEAAVPDTAAPRTAANALGLDITRPWVKPAEPLRRLFATQAPIDSPLGDGYTYVTDATPSPTGWEKCLVGIRASDGQITGIRYAVPGTFSPEPRAGLEDYAWNGAGYWVLDIGVS